MLLLKLTRRESTRDAVRRRLGIATPDDKRQAVKAAKRVLREARR